MDRLWVAVLSVSARTREKVTSKHGIDVDELRAHLVGVAGLAYRWDAHLERGLRAVVSVTVGGRYLAVVLYPAPDLGEDCYRLGSAYVL